MYDDLLRKLADNGRAPIMFREIAVAVLREGTELSFRAGGKSMSPFILDNEQVILEPLIRTLRVGDVILFETKSRHLTLHRIVDIKRDGYITRGDANRHADETVSHDAVLGRAVSVPGGLSFHLRSPLSRLVVHMLRLRGRGILFSIFRIPGRMLLSVLRRKNRP